VFKELETFRRYKGRGCNGESLCYYYRDPNRY
jgi:hypothetical protein